MKGCLVGPRKKGGSELLLEQEGKQIFSEFLYVPLPNVTLEGGKAVYEGSELKEFDFVLPRIPRTYLWFGYSLLSLLQDKVYLPLKPEALLLSHNKLLTLLVLKQAGLPVPETYFSICKDVLQKNLQKLRFPLVMKLLYGSLGKGVMFADSIQAARSVLDTLERLKHPFLLQKYVPNPGEDLRILVVGEEVLGGMKRIARRDERRANIAVGGRGKRTSITQEEKQLALQAAKVVGAKVCGVDLIRGNPPVLIEVNVNVIFEEFTRCTGINVARKILEFVEKEARGKGFIEKFVEWLRLPF